MGVIIIGAGIAGLAAADELIKAGIKPLVIEARDRIGGRIYTLRDDKSSAPIELGAEFVHGRPPQIFQTAEGAGIEIVETGGNFWYLTRDGRLAPTDDEPPGSEENVWDRIKKYTRKVPGDISLEHFLQLPESSSIHSENREWLRNYVAGFHAAEIDKVGIKSLVKTLKAEEAIEGERAFRIPAGYDRLADHLYVSAKNGGATFMLKTRVKLVNWGRRSVDVSVETEAGNETIYSKATIVTLPLGVLRSSPDSAGYVRFVPELKEKRAALKKIEMGAARRIVCVFKNKWWIDLLATVNKDKAKLGFLFAHDVPISVWWSSEPLGAPLMTGWAGGRKAFELSKLSSDQVIEAGLTSLCKIFNIGRSRIEDEMLASYTHDWQNDPFSLGAYTYLGVDGVGAPRELAARIGKTLYFAGEATCYEGHWGTVHGAIASGIRAAREVISDA